MKSLSSFGIKLVLTILVINTLIFILNSQGVFHLGGGHAGQRAINYDRPIEDVTIDRILFRLHASVQFFEKNYKSVNLDGLYGLRIAQGALHSLLDNYQYEKNIYLDLIDILNRRLDKLAALVQKAVEEDSPGYASSFNVLIQKPFLIKGSEKIRNLRETRINRFLDPNVLITSFNEPFSDSCYSLMIDSSTKCKTSSECFKFFTEDRASDYYLTHQLLYFIIADYTGCMDQVINDLIKYTRESETSQIADLLRQQPGSSDMHKMHIINHYCARIYHEADSLYKFYANSTRNMDKVGRDLFIEQSLLCGMYNYEEFFRTDWLRFVLRFQQTNGCFGEKFDSVLNDQSILSSQVFDYIHRSDDHVDREKETRKRSLRFKRYDKEMVDACSSHETGIAIGYLSVFLRYELDGILKSGQF